MKIFITMIIVLFCLFGCRNHRPAPDSGSAAGFAVDSVRDKEQRLFFREISGAQGQDTLTASLLIRKDAVTGEMQRIIYQKDRRSGTVNGMLKGDSINAIWTFMQEGVLDSIHVMFRIKEGQLTIIL